MKVSKPLFLRAKKSLLLHCCVFRAAPKGLRGLAAAATRSSCAGRTLLLTLFKPLCLPLVAQLRVRGAHHCSHDKCMSGAAGASRGVWANLCRAGGSLATRLQAACAAPRRRSCPQESLSQARVTKGRHPGSTPATVRAPACALLAATPGTQTWARRLVVRRAGHPPTRGSTWLVRMTPPSPTGDLCLCAPTPRAP